MKYFHKKYVSVNAICSYFCCLRKGRRIGKLLRMLVHLLSRDAFNDVTQEITHCGTRVKRWFDYVSQLKNTRQGYRKYYFKLISYWRSFQKIIPLLHKSKNLSTQSTRQTWSSWKLHWCGKKLLRQNNNLLLLMAIFNRKWMKEVDLQRTMDSIFHVCKFDAGQTMFSKNQWKWLFGRLFSSLPKSII